MKNIQMARIDILLEKQQKDFVKDYGLNLSRVVREHIRTLPEYQAWCIKNGRT